MEIIKQATLWLATGAEAVGAAIIGLALIEGAGRVALNFLLQKEIDRARDREA